MNKGFVQTACNKLTYYSISRISQYSGGRPPPKKSWKIQPKPLYRADLVGLAFAIARFGGNRYCAHAMKKAEPTTHPVVEQLARRVARVQQQLSQAHQPIAELEEENAVGRLTALSQRSGLRLSAWRAVVLRTA